jgi:hypothetical protein
MAHISQQRSIMRLVSQKLSRTLGGVLNNLMVLTGQKVSYLTIVSDACKHSSMALSTNQQQECFY